MRRAAATARALLGLAVMGAIIGYPAHLFLGASVPALPNQLAPPRVTLSSSGTSADPQTESSLSIPVLAYHDVSDRGGDPTVTPLQFAEHMAALDDAGFETVTFEMVERFIAGEPVELPAKPVLLTFDDGAASLYTTVDPILAVHGFEATAFLITAVMPPRGGGYYLDWRLVDLLVATGRWTFGGHTHDLHDLRPLPEGGTGPPLANRLVLDGREETFDEWRARVVADLDANADAFLDHLGHPPVGFAYPFTSRSIPSNDDRIHEELGDMVRERFSLAFGGGHFGHKAITMYSDPAELPRLGVRADHDADGLLEMIDAATPLAPTSSMAQLPWVGLDGVCEPRGDALALRGTSYVRCIVEAETSLWRDYRMSLRVHGVSRDATASVAVRDGPGGRVQLSLGETQGRIEQLTAEGWQLLEEFDVEPAPVHHIDLQVSGHHLETRIGDLALRTSFDATLDAGAPSFAMAPRDQQTITVVVTGLSPLATTDDRPTMLEDR